MRPLLLPRVVQRHRGRATRDSGEATLWRLPPWVPELSRELLSGARVGAWSGPTAGATSTCSHPPPGLPDPSGNPGLALFLCSGWDHAPEPQSPEPHRGGSDGWAGPRATHSASERSRDPAQGVEGEQSQRARQVHSFNSRLVPTDSSGAPTPAPTMPGERTRSGLHLQPSLRQNRRPGRQGLPPMTGTGSPPGVWGTTS